MPNPIKIYRLHFMKPEKKYASPIEELYVYLKENGDNKKIELSIDGSLIVREVDIKKYWGCGGGVRSCVFIGEMDAALFNPVQSEQEFIDNIIKSKQNGTIVGHQG